jgi:hypothetical protein
VSTELYPGSLETLTVAAAGDETDVAPAPAGALLPPQAARQIAAVVAEMTAVSPPWRRRRQRQRAAARVRVILRQVIVRAQERRARRYRASGRANVNST